MTTSEPTTDNVIQQIEGRPTLIEAAKMAQDAADAILNRVEPTTGEIVEVLRENGDVYFDETEISCDQIADHLESQEREIVSLREAKSDWKSEVTNPTHADFARAYRELAERKMNAIGLVCVDTAKIHQAANIIESQERELSGISGELERMTARAGQAERERDAMVKSVDRLVEAWENFKSPALIEFLKQWRELPQEGEQNNGQANNDHLR